MAAQPDAPIRMLHDDEITQIFAEADLDGDGTIDFDEVRQVVVLVASKLQ